MALDQVLNSPHFLRRFSPSPVVLRLMTEAAKPEPDLAALAGTIRTDPALAASVLSLVNSPYYGLTKKVSDIQRAAVVLGVREILKTAFLSSLQKDTGQNLKEAGYDAEADWRLALWSAVAAELLARRLCPEQADLAYLCALLKDVSLLFLRSAAPELLTPGGEGLLTALAPGQVRAEEESWGMDHAALSRLLLAKWGLPPEIGEGLAAHHDMDGLESRPPLARVVILATQWAESELSVRRGPFSVVRFNHRLRTALGVGEHELEALRSECLVRYRALLQSLGLSETREDEGYFRHSIKAMQEAYFMSMDLLTAEGGVEAVAELIGRHLGLAFDLREWDLALKSPHGGGYCLFQSSREGGLVLASGPVPSTALPWRLRAKGTSLRSGDRKWGELRHRAQNLPEPEAAALSLYLRFVGQAYENYCARQAVLEEKAWAFDVLPLGVARLTPHGELVQTNRRFNELTGQEAEVLRGRNLARVLEDRLGLYLGPDWQSFLDDPGREAMSRIVCFRDKRGPDGPQEVCAYLSAHREAGGEAGGDQGRILFLVENLRELSRMEVQALHRRDFLERLVGSMRDLVLTVDDAGGVTFSSLDGEAGIGADFFARFQPAETFSGSWGPALLDQADLPVVEAALVQPDGSKRPFELIFSKLEKTAGRGQDTLVVARDMTAVRRLEKELKIRAMFDGLTGLYNHAQFRAVLEREVRRSRRTGRNMGLIFFDLDGFKNINDTKGHQAGDSILRLVGEILTREVRQGMDFPCRYGGDEFAVIVTEVEDKQLETVGERLRRAIFDQFAGKVTISAGLTSLGPADSVDSLLNRADRAAYSAKGAGGDTVVWAK